ncbi:heavy metal translocating P-type ATPase [Desulfosarcina ovata]|nr:cation-translocating P-type ATPase [Desulfosarcina ovata]
MAHGFVREMLKAEPNHFRLTLGTCLLGGLLLGVSYLARLVFDQVELSAMVSLAAAILLGSPLVTNALKDLWRNRLEMNELAALSFVVSLGSTQYQTAALIAFFLVSAQLIEYRSQLGARKNLEALLRLAPQKAWVKREKGFEEVEATALKTGDVVRVRAGDQIPGDGTVIEGISSVDQATITGESLPIDKKTGDRVFGGTINQTGLLTIRITAKTNDTTLAKIQTLIAQAENNRTPAARLANRYVSWYTPLVLMCAAIVLFFTHDLNRAIAMLIVACPCTIILSTPTAFVAALSAAARLGVIVKKLHFLEVANRVDTLIFDKTGTLTTGRLKVVAVNVNKAVEEDELVALAAGLEQYSSHPVAKAVMAEVRKRRIDPRTAVDVEETPGFGIQGKLNGSRIAIGRRRWIEKQCPDHTLEAVGHEGTTGLHVARDNRWIGSLHLADTVRPDARAVIEKLRSHAVRQVVMLTGDRRSAAERIAAQLSCEVEAEVMPGQKMARVEEARQQGCMVGVVGDGVNDAPALAAGDVSIAMGAAGSDVAIHSAGIVLMNDQLDRIPFVFTLSRRVVATIRQNLAFSTLFILVLFWLSAAGSIPPVLAAVLHTASSLFVVFNSARLLRVGEELS